MAAKVQVICTYGTPVGFEGLGKLNRSFHPPHALVDGRETSLKWDEPIDLEVPPGQDHKLEVYFRVFDVLRMCGAEVDLEPLEDGETRSYEYRVELKDRYLQRGHLSRVG